MRKNGEEENDECEEVIHLFLWSVISVVPFPQLHVTSHPLHCVLDGGHRKVWQRALVAVE